MSSLGFHVYRNGERVAAFRYASDVAPMLLTGGPAVVKYAGRIVYRHRDGDQIDSFDFVAQSILAKIDEHRAERLARIAAAPEKFGAIVTR